MGATVFLNNRKIGVTPLRQQSFSPGEYTVKVTKLGYLNYEEGISIVRGKIAKIYADLLPFAGILKITSNVAGAEVLVDGKLIGRAPLEKELKLGSHVITIKKKGFTSYEEKLRSDPGNEYEVKAELTVMEGVLQPVEDDPLALAALPPASGGPNTPGGIDDLELASIPPPVITTGPTGLELASLPADSVSNNVVVPHPDSPNSVATAGAEADAKKPWYLQWWALTAGSAIVVGVVVGVSVAATSGSGSNATRPDRIWVPGQSFDTALVRF